MDSPAEQEQHNKTSQEKKGFQHVANNLTFPREAKDNIERLILFLHEALGHPTRSTLIRAVKKGTWQHGRASQ